MNYQELANKVEHILDDLQAFDIKSIDVKDLTSLTDMMVFCSGRSTRHVKSLAENLIDTLKKEGLRPMSVTGTDSSEWVLIDYNDILVHIMKPDVRAFYNIESLWSVNEPAEAQS